MSRPVALYLYLIVFLSGSCSCAPAEPATVVQRDFKRKSSAILDEMQIVPFADFRSARLIESFRKFITEQCGSHSIARLTLSDDQLDIWRALPIRFPEDQPLYRNPTECEHPKRVAQVVCIGRRASGKILNAGRVETINFTGPEPAWRIRVGKFEGEIVSFYAPGPSTVPDELTFSVTAGALPDVSVAEEVLTWLKQTTGVSLAHLYIRTDRTFGQFLGPFTDMFSLPYPDIPKTLWLRTPMIICAREQKCKQWTPIESPQWR